MSETKDIWSDSFDPPPKGLFRYEKRLVAFVDILGFKSLVEQSKEEPELLGEIVGALQGLVGISKAISKPELGAFHSQLFSDCFVVTCPFSEEVAPSFFALVNSIGWQLMPFGCWIRGAVTVGDLFVTDEMAVGPALVRTVELESMIANYPRIVISSEVLHVAKKFAPKTLARDTDGVFFLDYIRFGLEGIALGNSPLHELSVAGARKAKDRILVQLNATTEHPQIYNKLQWLSSRWQTAVSAEKNLSEFSLRR